MLEIFKIFSKIGLLGFGGPIANIALMEREIHHKRQWLSHSLFLKAYTLCKILPGPAAAQMAIFLGYIKGGFWGGMLSGSLFIIPGCLVAFFWTYLYFHFKEIGSLNILFYGMNPIILAIIADSAIRMGKSYSTHLKSVLFIILSFFWMLQWPHYELLLIFLCGLLNILFETSKSKIFDLSPLILLSFLCLKAGTLMFGGGLAIVPLLKYPMVEKYHWMTHQEFLDGLSIGMITPGPMLASVVFFGYKTAGYLGSIVAPICVFLPSFIFIFFAIPYIQKVDSLKWFRFFVDGAVPSIIGGIAAVLIPLGQSSLQDSITWILFLIGIVLLWFDKVPPWLLILIGGLSGIILKFLFGTE